MITVIDSIGAGVARIPETAIAIATSSDVSEELGVLSQPGLIGLPRGKNHDHIHDSINKDPGVIEGETHIDLRTHSQLGLRCAFSLGLD